MKYNDLDWRVRRIIDKAMMDAMQLGDRGPVDFTTIEFAAAWEWLHHFRGAGKTNAYGPLEQAAMTDANSHALRGFLVGWAMSKAYHEAIKGNVPLEPSPAT